MKSPLRNQHRLSFKSAWDDDGDDGPLDLSIAESWSKWKGRLSVGFEDKVTVHFITAYAEVYGQHPRTFHFAYDGTKIAITAPAIDEVPKKTIYARERSLSLCEIQPAITDFSHRRSMNAYHIDTRPDLVDNDISISPSCHDIWGGDGAMHCVQLMCMHPGAFMAQAIPFARSRNSDRDITLSELEKQPRKT